MAACIGIHAFALCHEAAKKEANPNDVENDNPFINDGLTMTTEESDRDFLQPSRAPTRLQLAKRQREKLKEKLFQSKIKKTQQRAQERRSNLGADISTSSLSD